MEKHGKREESTAPTGYPSIDRPWLKYYDEKVLQRKPFDGSMFDYLWENNKNHLDDIALVYFGRKISYGELFEGIEGIARALCALGIEPGDVITGIAPSFPEIIYAFYGANKIGAVSNWLDPRMDPKSVLRDIELTETKLVFVFDELLGVLESVLRESGVVVIVVSASDSLSWPMKQIAHLKGALSKRGTILKGAIKYSELVTHFKDGAEPVAYTADADQLALLEHTGGTTGNPKAVMLTNGNVNGVVEQYRYGGTFLSRSHSWLSVAFPFTAYSLICSQHLPLCLGMTSYLCFDMDISRIEKMLLDNKVNHMANTPVTWEYLMHSKRALKSDLSFLISPTVGADTLGVEKEREINEFLKGRDCAYRIVKGYGMTEVGSAVSVCPSNSCNKLGSVGIPFPWTDIAIFCEQTGEELPYGQQGEICIVGPTVMSGYLKDEEETNAVLKTHDDGTIWMHSGDLGRMDEDGFLFIDGRIKRMLIDHHGFKIFAPQLEAVIQKVDGVEKSCVVGLRDRQFGIGQSPVAFLILGTGTRKGQVLSAIQVECERSLPEYAVPVEFVVVDSFPYTSAGKVDYRKLEELAADLCVEEGDAE